MKLRLRMNGAINPLHHKPLSQRARQLQPRCIGTVRTRTQSLINQAYAFMEYQGTPLLLPVLHPQLSSGAGTVQ